MLFKRGDTVQWTSQASGSTRNAKKLGRVVAIVPAGVAPASIWGDVLNRSTTKMITEQRLRALGVDPEKYNYSPLGGGTARDHESYLVAVGRRPWLTGSQAKPKLYWPRARSLEKT